MCLEILRENLKPFVAKEDFYVYKVFFVSSVDKETGELKRLMTPYQCAPVKFGDTMRVETKRIHFELIKKRTDCNHVTPDYTVLTYDIKGEAIHCCIHRAFAESLCADIAKWRGALTVRTKVNLQIPAVFLCKIPVGAKYWINCDNTEIGTRELKICDCLGCVDADGKKYNLSEMITKINNNN